MRKIKDFLIRFLIKLLCFFFIKRKPKYKLHFYVDQPIPKGRFAMFSVNCTTEEKVLVTIAPVTEAGVAVIPTSPLVITIVSGDGSFELVDNSSFYLISGFLVGDTQYTISAEFDPDGDGTTESLADSIILTVGQAKVVGFGFNLSAAILK